MAANWDFNFAAALKGAGGEGRDAILEHEKDSGVNRPSLHIVGPNGLTKMDWWTHFESVFSEMNQKGTKYMKIDPHFSHHQEVFATLRKQKMPGFGLMSIQDLSQYNLLILHTVTLQTKDMFMQKCHSLYSKVYRHRKFGRNHMPCTEVEFFNKCLIDFIIYHGNPLKHESWYADMGMYALVPWFNHSSNDDIKHLADRFSQVDHLKELEKILEERFFNLLCCWVVDAEFGLKLIHALGELMLAFPDFVTGLLISRICEDVIPFVSPLGNPLPQYEEIYNLFVFYHCAAIRNSKNDAFNALLVFHLLCELKFKGHESLLIVEEAFKDELVDVTYGDFTGFLTCLDLPIRTNNPGVLATRPHCGSHLTLSKEDLQEQRKFDRRLKSHEDRCQQHWKNDSRYRRSVKEKLDDALKMEEKVVF
ncbi:uncharacterized protein LOC102806762 isoform X2 [Saccoglossus kowalevskii]